MTSHGTGVVAEESDVAPDAPSSTQTASGAHREIRKPILIGANPAVQLFDESGAATAYVSCWRVDWSIHGTGTALVLWEPDGVHVYGDDSALGLWLANYYVRWFPELDGLPWNTPRFTRCAAHLDIDLLQGMRAWAAELRVEAGDILDRRSFATDTFALDEGREHSLHLVLAPCAYGRIIRNGRPLLGEVRRSGTTERPGSSAFVTEAEVWRRAD